ncbi:MAG: Transcriptional regulator [Daejeonella sp.]|nr:Transcriptional regulator [Daejeonella sp.]
MKNTILIIEDNDTIRLNTATFLEKANYKVLQAANGKTGLKMAQKFPDLIICDIMMPKMNGYSLLYMLNKNPAIANIPFLFLTSKYESDKTKSSNTDILLSINYLLENRVKDLTIKSKCLKSIEKLLNEIDNNNGVKASSSFKLISYKKKEIIYYEGTQSGGIYLILKGHIKTLNLSTDGKEIFTGIYGREEFLGTRAVLTNESFFETAETMDETTVCFIPSEKINQLINFSKNSREKLIKLLSQNIPGEEDKLTLLTKNAVRTRMAGVLLRLATPTQETNFGVKISDQHLASLMGIPVETVNLTLKDFKSEGIIKENSDDNFLLLDSIRLLRLKQMI